MTNTQLWRRPQPKMPDFEIARRKAVHGRAVQKECLVSAEAATRIRVASLLTLGSLAAWLSFGLCDGPSRRRKRGPHRATERRWRGRPERRWRFSRFEQYASERRRRGRVGLRRGPRRQCSRRRSFGLRAARAAPAEPGAGGIAGTGAGGGAATAGAAGMPATECSIKRGIAYAFDRRRARTRT